MKKLAIAALVLTASFGLTTLAAADGTYQTLPFAQNWSNPAAISTSDDWSGVPGVIGYRGDNLVAATGVDPQTLLLEDIPPVTATSPVVDVNANLLLATDPNTFTSGGVAEFEFYGAVALNGSGTGDAPYLQLFLDTTGKENITVAYNVVDLDASADNSIQQVAMHYRVGTTGLWTNVPAAYVADGSQGPSLSGSSIAVSAVLPVDAADEAQLQVRIMTTNAAGNDEWVSIDDITVTGTDIPVPTDEASWGEIKATFEK